MSAQNKQQVLEFLEHAFANRMPEAIAGLHPDASWWVSGDPAQLRVAGLKNRLKIERLLAGFSAAIPAGMQINIGGVTAENNRVAVEVEAEGLWHDGRRYHNRYHFLIELRDGLIFVVREYMDTLHLYQLSQV